MKLEEILSDQKFNEDIQTKSRLIERKEVYLNKSAKKEKIILQEEFSIKLIYIINNKDVHQNFCCIGI